MDVDAIGFVTFAACVAVLCFGARFGIWALCLSLPLGSAAAIKLPAFGGASILPSVLIALALIVVVALNPKLCTLTIRSVRPLSPGFWLLAFTLYGIVAAIFLPRIFAGMVYVYSLSRVGEDIGIISLPLAPRTSNITQSGYLVVTMLTFLVVQAIATAGGTRSILTAVLAAAFVLLFFAGADLITYSTGTGWLLGFIRNANYRMLESGQIGALKRLVGSFSEAGAYSYAALGFYAFCLSLWLSNIRPRLTGALAAVLALTLLASTSSMAYASLATFSLIIFCGRIANLVAGRLTRQEMLYLLLVMATPVALITLIVFAPSVWTAILHLYDATLTNKLATQSGIERMRWNEHAYRAFVFTYGWGAGNGSVRASSVVLALLANVGVVGAILFATMLFSVVAPRGVPRTDDEKTARAASHACLALAIAACISAGSTDLGLIFALFGGVAASTRIQPAASGLRERRFALPVSPTLKLAAAS